MPISNRYEFMVVFDCQIGNPNGDPDTGDSPRVDPQDGHGFVSGVSLKRRIRDYAALMEQQIFVQHSTNLNRRIRESREETNTVGVEGKEAESQASAWLCEKFFDIRTFGAVMTTGVNAGQVRGPVQITNARSVEPVFTLNWAISRVASTENLGASKTTADYEAWEATQPSRSLRTLGQQHLIPYGLFVASGFISAYDAKKTGFSDADLEILFESVMNMFEHSRSATKGFMSTRRLIIFRHIGTDKNKIQRDKQAIHGCVPAHLLLDLGNIVTIKLIDETHSPRAFKDYAVLADPKMLPKGIEMLDLPYWDKDQFSRAWKSS